MTSKERMATAMRMEVPDRVPVACQLAAGHYFLHSGLDPKAFWFEPEAYAEGLIRMQQRYQFDSILVNLHGREPNWRQHLERVEEEHPGEQWLYWRDAGLTKFPPSGYPRYFAADETSTHPAFSEVDPERLFYIEPWDTTGVNYPFTWGFDKTERPFSDFFPPSRFEALQRVLDQVGDTVSVHGEVFSPFSLFLDLLGPEAALPALDADPDKSLACMQAFLPGAVACALAQAERGVDAILISSVFAGSNFITRDQYKRFVLPYERELVESIHAIHPALPLYTHTCGGLGDRLDLLMATGTNGIDALDPPPLGTISLEEAVRQTEGKLFIKGNLDPVNTFLYGDREAVAAAAKQAIDLAAPGGGYIASTACAMVTDTPPELIEHFSAVVREQGHY